MINLHTSLKGEYRMVVRSGSKVVRDSGWMPNLITDGGLNGIGDGTMKLAYCSVGEGNTPPANTDTSLQTFHQSTGTRSSITTVNSGSPTYIKQTAYVFLFPINSVNKNYAEIGVGVNSTGTALFSRALIVDSGGAPTTFTVLTGEQLEVTYRLWQYAALTDQVSAVTISGTPYTTTVRGTVVNNTSGADNFVHGVTWSTLAVQYGNGAMTVNTSIPSPGTSGGSPSSVAAYTPGSFYRDFTWNVGTNSWNLAGGLKVFWNLGIPLSLGGFLGHTYQIGVSPAIPKDNTKTMSLTFRISWGRH